MPLLGAQSFSMEGEIYLCVGQVNKHFNPVPPDLIKAMLVFEINSLKSTLD